MPLNTSLGRSNNFPNHQLTWSADKVVMAVDGVPYFEFVNPKDGDYDKWPFNKPQFMILNLAMGGDLGGAIPSTFNADQMVVDYVRVYQKEKEKSRVGKVLMRNLGVLLTFV